MFAACCVQCIWPQSVGILSSSFSVDFTTRVSFSPFAVMINTWYAAATYATRLSTNVFSYCAKNVRRFSTFPQNTPSRGSNADALFTRKCFSENRNYMVQRRIITSVLQRRRLSEIYVHPLFKIPSLSYFTFRSDRSEFNIVARRVKRLSVPRNNIYIFLRSNYPIRRGCEFISDLA